jgi:hypothetical protein
VPHRHSLNGGVLLQAAHLTSATATALTELHNSGTNLKKLSVV